MITKLAYKPSDIKGDIDIKCAGFVRLVSLFMVKHSIVPISNLLNSPKSPILCGF